MKNFFTLLCLCFIVFSSNEVFSARGGNRSGKRAASSSRNVKKSLTSKKSNGKRAASTNQKSSSNKKKSVSTGNTSSSTKNKSNGKRAATVKRNRKSSTTQPIAQKTPIVQPTQTNNNETAVVRRASSNVVNNDIDDEEDYEDDECDEDECTTLSVGVRRSSARVPSLVARTRSTPSSTGYYSLNEVKAAVVYALDCMLNKAHGHAYAMLVTPEVKTLLANVDEDNYYGALSNALCNDDNLNKYFLDRILTRHIDIKEADGEILRKEEAEVLLDNVIRYINKGETSVPGKSYTKEFLDSYIIKNQEKLDLLNSIINNTRATSLRPLEIE